MHTLCLLNSIYYKVWIDPRLKVVPNEGPVSSCLFFCSNK